MKRKRYIVLMVIVLVGALVAYLLYRDNQNNNIQESTLTDGVVESSDQSDAFNSEEEEEYVMLNMIAKTNDIYLQSTFMIDETSKIPFQNGIVYPNFLPQERLIIPLNGEWFKERFEGDYKFSLMPRNVEWIRQAQEKMGEIYSDQESVMDWELKVLPAPENKLVDIEATEGVEPYEGGVYYSRSFEVDETLEDKTLYLKSLGINYVCDVWINGHWVGWHEGGFTPFALDISEHIKINEENTIFLRIDNPPWGSRLDTIPAVSGTDFFNYTGVIQDIYIEAIGDVMISRNDMVTDEILEDHAILNNTMVITQHTEDLEQVQLISRIYESDPTKYEASPSIENIINYNSLVYEEEQLINISDLAPQSSELEGQTLYNNFILDRQLTIEHPKLWDVYEPNLYVMEVQLLDDNNEMLDVHYIQFGIRTIETEGTTILLNGRNIFLRGIAKHEEWPGFGRTSSWDRVRSDFQQMLEMGLNFIRTGHYPNHVNTYLYLDRIGIPSMSEIPLWQLETAHFNALDEKGLDIQMFREMVFSQYNSASVILWSTQNECKGIPARTSYNEKLVEDLRVNYDDSRLVTQSAAADQGGPRDASMEALDVNGWTMYFGVFHGSTPYNGTMNFLESVAEYWDKPTINTEYGVWSGDTDSDTFIQDRNYQQVFDALLENATILPNGYFNEDGVLAGIDYWIMYNWYVNHNQWIDTFGIFHMDRETMKVVGETLQNDYLRLQELTYRNDTISELEAMDLHNGGTYQGNQIRIDVPSISGFNILNLEEYNYLQLVFSTQETMPMIHIILEDTDGNQMDYYTDKVIRDEQTEINIPLYRVENIDFTKLESVIFSFRDEQEVMLESIMLN